MAMTRTARRAAAKKAARTRKRKAASVAAKRSAAAKKAARTRKRKAKAGGGGGKKRRSGSGKKRSNAKKSADAKKASAAGRIAEKKSASKLKRNHDQVHVGSGIPDILAHASGGWKFYEVKPHMKRRGYKKNGTWYSAGDKSRLLNKNQMSVFHQLVSKGEAVIMVYYYRKSYGSKTKPKYSFKYREVKLTKRHFKSSKGPDPEKMKPRIPKDIDRWMKNNRV